MSTSRRAPAAYCAALDELTAAGSGTDGAITPTELVDRCRRAEAVLESAAGFVLRSERRSCRACSRGCCSPTEGGGCSEEDSFGGGRRTQRGAPERSALLSTDVGPVLTVLVSVAHQPGGDRVAVGLVAYQYTTEVAASLWGELFEEGAKALSHPDLGARLCPDRVPAFGGSLG
jgi:hypothetical protein